MCVGTDMKEKIIYVYFILVSFGWFFFVDTGAPLIRRYIVLDFICLTVFWLYHFEFCVRFAATIFFSSFHSFLLVPFISVSSMPSRMKCTYNHNITIFILWNSLRSDFISSSQFCCTQFNFKTAWGWQVHTPSTISNHAHDTDTS